MFDRTLSFAPHAKFVKERMQSKRRALSMLAAPRLECPKRLLMAVYRQAIKSDQLWLAIDADATGDSSEALAILKAYSAL